MYPYLLALIVTWATLLAVAAYVSISSLTRPRPWTVAWLKRFWRRVAVGGFARTAMLTDPVSGRGVSIPVLLSFSAALFLLGCAVTGSRLLLSQWEVKRLRAALEKSAMPDSLRSSNGSMLDYTDTARSRVSGNS